MRISDWSSDVCSSDLALEDGAYEINLPEGTYDVLARGDSSAARLTAVAVEGEETSVDVALTPGAVIRGHISTPVASAMAAPVVVVRLAGSDDVIDAVVVDPIGAYEISGLPEGSYDVTFQVRSEEHTSELQSLMRISYAV